MLFLTAGVDVQANPARLEMTTVGWAAQEEAFVIGHQVFLGNPGESEVWNTLDDALRRVYTKDSGARIRIRAAGIDRNGGSAERVDNFCRDKSGRRIFSCFGAVTANAPIWPQYSSESKYNAKIWHVGVSQAKEAIYGALKIGTPETSGGQRDHYIHFSDDCTPEYFEQLTAEEARIETNKKTGRTTRSWKKLRERNEALDCMVYAFAAMRAVGKNLDKVAVQGDTPATQGDPTVVPPPPDPAQLQPAIPAKVKPLVAQPMRAPLRPRNSIWNRHK